MICTHQDDHVSSFTLALHRSTETSPLFLCKLHCFQRQNTVKFAAHHGDNVTLVHILLQIHTNIEGYHGQVVQRSLEFSSGDILLHDFLSPDYKGELEESLLSEGMSKSNFITFWLSVRPQIYTLVENDKACKIESFRIDIEKMVKLEAEEARVLEESRESSGPTTTPATEESIMGLNKINLEEACVICMQKLCRGTELCSMPCKHLFHSHCIIKWLRTSHVCPICRFAMPTRT
ncbi:hypothetical protein SLE2022_248850 [Rubroshorea leprosula]